MAARRAQKAGSEDKIELNDELFLSLLSQLRRGDKESRVSSTFLHITVPWVYVRALSDAGRHARETRIGRPNSKAAVIDSIYIY